ncbi:unnamed protein product [Amoebophrya sp. A25]|nr:unnamed protein product [Amoebophrya sp. A25]|eukprot:GSA25T00019392001.1
MIPVLVYLFGGGFFGGIASVVAARAAPPSPSPSSKATTVVGAGAPNDITARSLDLHLGFRPKDDVSPKTEARGTSCSSTIHCQAAHEASIQKYKDYRKMIRFQMPLDRMCKAARNDAGKLDELFRPSFALHFDRLMGNLNGASVHVDLDSVLRVCPMFLDVVMEIFCLFIESADAQRGRFVHALANWKHSLQKVQQLEAAQAQRDVLDDITEEHELEAAVDDEEAYRDELERLVVAAKDSAAGGVRLQRQIRKAVKEIVEPAAMVDAARTQQVEAARAEKESWKAVFDGVNVVVEKVRNLVSSGKAQRLTVPEHAQSVANLILYTLDWVTESNGVAVIMETIVKRLENAKKKFKEDRVEGQKKLHEVFETFPDVLKFITALKGMPFTRDAFKEARTQLRLEATLVNEGKLQLDSLHGRRKRYQIDSNQKALPMPLEHHYGSCATQWAATSEDTMKLRESIRQGIPRTTGASNWIRTATKAVATVREGTQLRPLLPLFPMTPDDAKSNWEEGRFLVRDTSNTVTKALDRLSICPFPASEIPTPLDVSYGDETIWGRAADEWSAHYPTWVGMILKKSDEDDVRNLNKSEEDLVTAFQRRYLTEGTWLGKRFEWRFLMNDKNKEPVPAHKTLNFRDFSVLTSGGGARFLGTTAGSTSGGAKGADAKAKKIATTSPLKTLTELQAGGSEETGFDFTITEPPRSKAEGTRTAVEFKKADLRSCGLFVDRMSFASESWSHAWKQALIRRRLTEHELGKQAMMATAATVAVGARQEGAEASSTANAQKSCSPALREFTKDFLQRWSKNRNPQEQLVSQNMWFDLNMLRYHQTVVPHIRKLVVDAIALEQDETTSLQAGKDPVDNKETWKKNHVLLAYNMRAISPSPNTTAEVPFFHVDTRPEKPGQMYKWVFQQNFGNSEIALAAILATFADLQICVPEPIEDAGGVPQAEQEVQDGERERVVQTGAVDAAAMDVDEEADSLAREDADLIDKYTSLMKERKETVDSIEKITTRYNYQVDVEPSTTLQATEEAKQEFAKFQKERAEYQLLISEEREKIEKIDGEITLVDRRQRELNQKKFELSQKMAAADFRRWEEKQWAEHEAKIKQRGKQMKRDHRRRMKQLLKLRAAVLGTSNFGAAPSEGALDHNVDVEQDRAASSDNDMSSENNDSSSEESPDEGEAETVSESSALPYTLRYLIENSPSFREKFTNMELHEAQKIGEIAWRLMVADVLDPSSLDYTFQDGDETDPAGAVRRMGKAAPEYEKDIRMINVWTPLNEDPAEIQPTLAFIKHRQVNLEGSGEQGVYDRTRNMVVADTDTTLAVTYMEPAKLVSRATMLTPKPSEQLGTFTDQSISKNKSYVFNSMLAMHGAILVHQDGDYDKPASTPKAKASTRHLSATTTTFEANYKKKMGATKRRSIESRSLVLSDRFARKFIYRFIQLVRYYGEMMQTRFGGGKNHRDAGFEHSADDYAVMRQWLNEKQDEDCKRAEVLDSEVVACCVCGGSPDGASGEDNGRAAAPVVILDEQEPSSVSSSSCTPPSSSAATVPTAATPPGGGPRGTEGRAEGRVMYVTSVRDGFNASGGLLGGSSAEEDDGHCGNGHTSSARVEPEVQKPTEATEELPSSCASPVAAHDHHAARQDEASPVERSFGDQLITDFSASATIVPDGFNASGGLLGGSSEEKNDHIEFGHTSSAREPAVQPDVTGRDEEDLPAPTPVLGEDSDLPTPAVPSAAPLAPEAGDHFPANSSVADAEGPSSVAHDRPAHDRRLEEHSLDHDDHDEAYNPRPAKAARRDVGDNLESLTEPALASTRGPRQRGTRNSGQKLARTKLQILKDWNSKHVRNSKKPRK